jgi:branched-chain amino acid transport system substrate-binding protein
MAVMAEGIKRTLDAGQELTGENIRASLEGIEGFSTGDVTGPLTFSPVDHRGNDTGRLYQVRSSVWEPVTDFLTSRIPINQ